MPNYYQPATSTGVRVCNICKETKPLAEFRFDNSKNVYGYYCRPCERAKWRLERQRRDSSVEGRNKERLRAKKYYESHHSEVLSKAIDPVKNKARKSLRNAVANGKIVKPINCESCGDVTTLSGHHEDYSKSFDVVWLCSACHGRLGRKPIPQAATNWKNTNSCASSTTQPQPTEKKEEGEKI